MPIGIDSSFHKADLVVPRRSEAAPSLQAACSSPVMISATGALLVKRVWRVTTSSRASKIGLMSKAALISCTTYCSVLVYLTANHENCHRKPALITLTLAVSDEHSIHTKR